MLRRMSSSPVRVGFKPTFRSSSPSAGGPEQAGHDEKRGGREIPGHRELEACEPLAADEVVVVSPSLTTRTPQLASIRSL